MRTHRSEENEVEKFKKSQVTFVIAQPYEYAFPMFYRAPEPLSPWFASKTMAHRSMYATQLSHSCFP